MEWAMIDDRLIPAEQLDATHLDRGLYFGDGVYEVIRSYDGAIFALEDHLRRFDRSLHEVHIEDISIEKVRTQVLKAFQQAGLANAKIYFHVTRGSEPRSHVPKGPLKPNFLLTIGPAPDSRPDKERGVSVSTFPDWRWKRCDIKSLNLLPNVLARMDAEKKGCAEAILVDEAGRITEGAGSAFFAVDTGRGELITRPLGPEILPSITRAHVLRVAEHIGLEAVERVLTPDAVSGIDELFLAVTTKDIVPVVRFEGATVGSGKPGQTTQKLAEAFAQMVREGAAAVT
jgi:D-alanine transaminase